MNPVEITRSFVAEPMRYLCIRIIARGILKTSAHTFSGTLLAGIGTNALENIAPTKLAGIGFNLEQLSAMFGSILLVETLRYVNKATAPGESIPPFPTRQ